MNLPRRRFLQLAAGAAALPAVPRVGEGASLSDAAGAPDRRLSPPAVRKDILARLVGQWLSERLGQPFVIDNRPGGGGNIGTESGRAGPGRRLHAAPGQFAEHDQCDALREAQLQFHPRHRPSRGPHPRGRLSWR